MALVNKVKKLDKLLLAAKCLAAVLILTSYSLSAVSKSYEKKRLLVIVSYHPGYAWSDAITGTIEAYFKKQTAGKVEIKKIYMDTKRNTSEVFKRKMALTVKQVIESWRPDVIIGIDDNASKYVIAPYFLNTAIPFVFCGLNDDPQTYGFPGTNVTGIREISLIRPLYDHLRQYAQGERIGYLTADKYTQRLMARTNEKQLGRTFEAIEFVNDFQEWKDAFLLMQNVVDMLFMIDVSTLPDWNRQEALRFIEKNTKIPSGATSEFSREYVLLSVSKSSAEHGSWAAQAAWQILNGKKPTDIPITINKKGSISLNFILADKLNIVFAPSLLRAAETVIEK